ncbi:MAG: tryptophanase [Planctomycetes bacterium]|nr:tryptophanase [Planctomycetota bacterium]
MPGSGPPRPDPSLPLSRLLLDFPWLRLVLDRHRVRACCGGACSLREAVEQSGASLPDFLRSVDEALACDADASQADAADAPEAPFRTAFEPFRIKVVEPLGATTRADRTRALEAVGYNLFRLPAAMVLIDLLTDSGTSAMSAEQWSALFRADEAYAGSRSFYRFEEEVRELTGFKHVIPTHQGRAAERILFSLVGGPRHIVPSNTLFDTTRANVEASGARGVDLPVAEGLDTAKPHPFKGNIDLDALETLLAGEGRGAIPLVLMTLTNNAVGGQPVSLANLRDVRALCAMHGVPLFLDAARFAENCWLIREREPGQSDRSPRAIAREVFSLADGCVFSGKKDGLSNMGGFLAVHDDALAARARDLLVLGEGFPTYGGMAARDLEALAVGLRECLEPDYLDHRIRSVARFGEALRRAGLPLVEPVGGHAVFLDAARLLPRLGPDDFPAQALACALYREGGVRGVEVGTLMFGRTDPATGRQVPARHELVRLAVPRRVYTRCHLEYVAEVAGRVAEHADRLGGLSLVEEPPALRHFGARLRPRAAARTRCPEVW